MSEPVIPERKWNAKQMLAAKAERASWRIEADDLQAKLTAAEAKLAEHEATITKEESRSNELAKEVAILRVDLKGQAAIIEQLTGALQHCKRRSVGPRNGRSKQAQAICLIVDAALSKQEPK